MGGAGGMCRGSECPWRGRRSRPRARGTSRRARDASRRATHFRFRRGGRGRRRDERRGRGADAAAAVSAARVACAAASVMPRGRRARGRREGGGRDAAGRGARGETRRAETGEICGRRGLRAVEAELSNDRGARRETRGRRRARGGGSTRACVARGATPETNGACGCGDACVRGRMCRVAGRRRRGHPRWPPPEGWR